MPWSPSPLHDSRNSPPPNSQRWSTGTEDLPIGPEEVILDLSIPGDDSTPSPVSLDNLGSALETPVCSHRPGEYCSKCRKIVSPRKRRAKGLQKAIQPGVGSGHGRKEVGFCSTLTDDESTHNNGEDMDDNDMSEDFKTPRARNDRIVNEVPPTRVTRSMALGNAK